MSRLRSAILLLAFLGILTGCGQTGGAALFMFGLFDRPTIEAEYEFGDGLVAVLVDDPFDTCFWSEVPHELTSAMVTEMDETKAAKDLVSPSKITRLRQLTPDFEERGAREVGKLLGADEVLWVEIQSFYASEDPDDVTRAARISLVIKVINANEDERTKVRLWPESPAGYPIEVELGAGSVARAKTRKGIVKALSTEVADRIVKRFHDHKMEDFEKE